MVGVVGEVVVVEPGDGQDGDLQAELHGGLGEDGQRAEDPGPGQCLELVEPLLPLADVDEVPHHQAEGEQDGPEEEDPEAELLELLKLCTLEVPMQVVVGVAQKF